MGRDETEPKSARRLIAPTAPIVGCGRRPVANRLKAPCTTNLAPMRAAELSDSCFQFRTVLPTLAQGPLRNLTASCKPDMAVLFGVFEALANDGL